MVLFGRLRRRCSSDESISKAGRAACHHRVLVPLWDDPADLGVESRATSYRCDGCAANFNPLHAYLLRLEATHYLRSIGEERAAKPGPQVDRLDRYDDRTFVRSLELAAAHLYGQQSSVINQEGSRACELLDSNDDR
jgi:hypothetical protein